MLRLRLRFGVLFRYLLRMVRSQWLLLWVHGLWVALPWLIMLLLRVLRLRVMGPMLQVERPLGVPRLRLRVMLPRVILDQLFSYIVSQRLNLIHGVMLPLLRVMRLWSRMMLPLFGVMRLGLRVMLPLFGVMLPLLGVMRLWTRVMRLGVMRLRLRVMLPLFGVMLPPLRVMLLWLIPGLRVMLLGTGVILNQLLSQILG